MAGVALVSVLTSGSVAAQNSPNSFQLPTPTPTPTQAPQGPVDVRSGVPIGPRIIPERRAEQPAPATPVATPTPAPTPVPDSGAPDATTAAEPTVSATDSPPPPAVRQSPAREPAARTTAAPATPSPALSPTGEAEAGSLTGAAPAIGTDDWYDVDQIGTQRDTAAIDPQSDFPGAIPETSGGWGDTDLAFDQTKFVATSGVLLILLLGAGFWVWRRRMVAEEALELPGPALAAGVRKSIAATKPSLTLNQPKHESPVAEIAPLDLSEAQIAEPLNVDLTLEIESASRSIMMFMVDYRLTIANRSDKAARDIEVTGQLKCAQRGGANAPTIAGGQPLGEIDRIGPHQSRSVSGQLQMPLTEVHAIRQGQKPIFIPLLHVSVVGAGDHSLTRSFVVGEPSATSQGRVHPIRLDTPPGGLPGLQAREVSLETA